MERFEHLISIFGPNLYLQAALIMVLSMLAAVVAQLLLTRLLPRLTSKTDTDLDDELLGGLARPVFVTFLVIGAQLALLRLGISENATIKSFAVPLLRSVAVLVWIGFLFQAAAAILAALSRNKKSFTVVQPETLPLFDNVAKVVLFGAAIYMLIKAWGKEPTALLTSAGVVGLALGLAAKDTLANLFAGLSILADKPYKVGDFIVLSSGERGEVTQVGIRSSRVMTRDDIEIIVPNSILATSTIINEAGGPHPAHRLRVKIGVAYGSDIDQVERVLMSIAEGHEEILEQPEPRVRFRAFGDSSLDFELLGWIPLPVLRGRVLHELNKTVYKRFQQEGIEIPFPQRDVHLIKPPAEIEDSPS